MAEYARVGSIDALRALRSGVLRFIEAAEQATFEVESEIQRTLEWLRRDQAAHWRGQVRRRTEDVRRARLALNRKKSLPAIGTRPPSTVEEEDALNLARRRLEEAEQKIQAVKVWAQRIEKKRTAYRGSLGPFLALTDGELPRAVRELDQMVASLDAYVALETPDAEVAPAGAGMPRPGGPEDDEPGAPARPAETPQDRDDER